MADRNWYDPARYAHQRGRPPGTGKAENDILREALRRWDRAGRPSTLSALAKELGVGKNRLTGVYWRMGLAKPRKPAKPQLRKPSAPRAIGDEHANE